MANAPLGNPAVDKQDSSASDYNLVRAAVAELQGEVNALETETPAVWAQAGNTQQIPADKLGNAPTGEIPDRSITGVKLQEDTITAREMSPSFEAANFIGDGQLVTRQFDRENRERLEKVDTIETGATTDPNKRTDTRQATGTNGQQQARCFCGEELALWRWRWWCRAN